MFPDLFFLKAPLELGFWFRLLSGGPGVGARTQAQGGHPGTVLDSPGTRQGAFSGQVLDMFRNVLKFSQSIENE